MPIVGVTAAIPLSLSMPLSIAEHDDKAVRPFMWGLLPDNDDTLGSLARQYNVSPRNPFPLLAEIGEDLQGAIQMVPPDKLGELKKREGVTPLSQAMLIESSPLRPRAVRYPPSDEFGRRLRLR